MEGTYLTLEGHVKVFSKPRFQTSAGHPNEDETHLQSSEKRRSARHVAYAWMPATMVSTSNRATTESEQQRRTSIWGSFDPMN